MLRILTGEGWQIKERELLRMRTKHGWLLRGANGFQATFNQTAGQKRNRHGDDPAAVAEDALAEPLVDSLIEVHQPPNVGAQKGESPRREASGPPLPQLDSHAEALRQARRTELQQQSDSLRAGNKRRRRTHGYAGLPADPPGPPRFPSETTLDESKAFLRLSNEQYQAVRDQFAAICHASSITKKSQAGPEKWQAVKDRLIRDNANLHREFHGPFNGVAQTNKQLALDVICMDVTKRMRTSEKRMTITNAKDILSLNPDQSRSLRSEFYSILKADNFVSKLEAGADHWNELKKRWTDSSALVKEVLNRDGGADHDPNHAQKLTALEVLSRDVMKRIRDDVTRADPSRKREGAAGPGPGPARPRVSASSSAQVESVGTVAHTATHSQMSGITRKEPVKPRARRPKGKAPVDAPIDPALVGQSDDHSMAQLQAYAASAAASAAPGPSLLSANHPGANASSPLTANALPHPIAALFRQHADTPIAAAPRAWFATVTSTSIAELVGAASSPQGAGSAPFAVRKIEGLLPGPSGGPEMPFQIEGDDEIAAYLQYVGNGRVVFAVTLGDGTL